MRKRLLIILALALGCAAFVLAQKIPHGITLTWLWTGTGTPTYSVYRSTVSGGEQKPALATGLTSATFTDTSAAPNTQYFFTVTATVGGVESAPSTEVGALIAVPGAPTSPGTSVF